MNWTVARIKWIMLVSGALTCTLVDIPSALMTASRSSPSSSSSNPTRRLRCVHVSSRSD
jgi:hypothetical protein